MTAQSSVRYCEQNRYLLIFRFVIFDNYEVKVEDLKFWNLGRFNLEVII